MTLANATPLPRPVPAVRPWTACDGQSLKIKFNTGEISTCITRAKDLALYLGCEVDFDFNLRTIKVSPTTCVQGLLKQFFSVDPSVFVIGPETSTTND